MRTLSLSGDEIEMLVDAIEEACDAVAAEYDLLETAEADGESSEADLDEEQEDALDWIQQLLELREKIARQADLPLDRDSDAEEESEA